MLRFDSEVELESHVLGRSLLFMVNDDAIGNDSMPRLVPITAPADPFQLVREASSCWFSDSGTPTTGPSLPHKSLRDILYDLPCNCNSYKAFEFGVMVVVL